MTLAKHKSSPSERELGVMSVLWELGDATVTEVQRAVNELWEPELAYNTVLTYLRSLKAKGWVRSVAEGRAHRFYPVVAREHARWEELLRITDLLYDGSRELLVSDLLSDRRLQPRALERLRHLLDARLASGRPAPAPQRATQRSRGPRPARPS